MSIWRRIAGTFGDRSLRKEHQEELEFHTFMREQWNVEHGLEPAAARRDALVRFGSIAKWREQLREIDVWTLPESVGQDLRFGARMLAKHPGFTLAAIAALALGIGLNTVTFTLGKATFDRRVEAHDADRIVNLSLIGRKGEFYSFFSYPDYEAYRDQTRTFSAVIAESREMVTLTAAGGASARTGSKAGALIEALGLHIPRPSTGDKEFATVSKVSENYFEVLGEPPLRGRSFSARDRADLLAHPSALLSANYWERRFQSDPTVIGRSVKLNGSWFTVIGITPLDFAGTSVVAPDFWIPMVSTPLLHPGVDTLHDRNDASRRIFARLADGATMAQAQAEVQGIADRLRPLHDPRSDEARPSSAMIWPGSPFARKIDSGVVFAATLIMLAVGLVLVIACANVASLQLARAAARQNELNMRRSLGASRARIVRQLLTESVLLAGLAGVVALFFSWILLRVIVVEYASVVPPEFGTPILHVNPDLKIFAFVLGVSVLAGVMFGVAPALESSRSTLGRALQANRNASTGRGRTLRQALVATQVAMCMVLMIAGALLIRSSMRSLKVKYEVKRVLNVELQFPDDASYTNERKVTLTREIQARLAALPGVTQASAGRAPDGDGVRLASVSTDTRSTADRADHPRLFYTYVRPNYFSLLNIPVVAGRGFDTGAGGKELAAVVSHSAATALWHGESPIGKMISLSTEGEYHPVGEATPDGGRYEVVGVVADAGGTLLDGSDEAQIYVPLGQDRIYDHALLLRTNGDPKPVRDSVGEVVARVDPAITAYSSTLEEMLHETPRFAVSRCAAIFATIVGSFGLLLACLGIYGTVSYMAVLRTREAGIRMALGASRNNVLRWMLRDSMRPVVAGIAAGLVLAAGASWLLRGLLYGLGTMDVPSFGGMAMLFLLIAAAAAFLPSRAATKVDPMVALRYE